MSDPAIIESDCLAEGIPHPRFTKNLYGQGAAEEQFLSAVRHGRLLHAWLVTGPRGCGKATLAWKICKFLMVRAYQIKNGTADENPANLDIDHDHPAARRVRALSEPSFTLVRRPYDSDRKRVRTQITVNEIRNLGDQFALATPDGQPLIAIIDAADDMNNFAANALLKLLEEPPDNAFMFLISHSPNQLLPTIRSRCGFLRCQPLAEKDLNLAVAAAGISLGDNAKATAELASGSAGVAIQLHANDGIEIYRNLIKIIKTMPELAWHKAYTLAAECSGQGSEINYATTVAAILIFLARLSKTAVGISLGEAVNGEKECLSRLGRSASPKHWTSLQSDLVKKSEHARLVNLDPMSVVLDMLLSINQTVASNVPPS